MSWRLMSAVWDLTDGIKSSEKWLLFTLAYKHNDETGRCNPSVTYLAKHCRLSERRTRDMLHSLERKGFIKVLRVKAERGDYTSNQYDLSSLGGGAIIAPPLFSDEAADCPRVGQSSAVPLGQLLPQGGATPRLTNRSSTNKSKQQDQADARARGSSSTFSVPDKAVEAERVGA